MIHLGKVFKTDREGESFLYIVLDFSGIQKFSYVVLYVWSLNLLDEACTLSMELPGRGEILELASLHLIYLVQEWLHKKHFSFRINLPQLLLMV